MAARGEIAREVGRQRRLADAALRVGDHDHRHASPPFSFCGYVSAGARAAATSRRSHGRRRPAHGLHRSDRRRRSDAAALAAEILVLVAHPELEQSRVNRAPDRRRARAAARQPAGRIAVRDLYALYPDYLIDVAAEQAALAAAALVVWQQPIHWYGMPPLLKLWLDDVLTFGWAYGPERHGAARQGPVAGREHRRPRGLVPARQLQPLLLRRLPAALRADRRALRHALPAAAGAARRAQGERGRARTRTPTPTRSGSPTIRTWPRDRARRGLRRVRRCRRARARPTSRPPPMEPA